MTRILGLYLPFCALFGVCSAHGQTFGTSSYAVVAGGAAFGCTNGSENSLPMPTSARTSCATGDLSGVGNSTAISNFNSLFASSDAFSTGGATSSNRSEFNDTLTFTNVPPNSTAQFTLVSFGTAGGEAGGENGSTVSLTYQGDYSFDANGYYCSKLAFQSSTECKLTVALPANGQVSIDLALDATSIVGVQVGENAYGFAHAKFTAAIYKILVTDSNGHHVTTYTGSSASGHQYPFF